MKGIRIELPKKFFPEYKYQSGDYGNWGFTKETTCPFKIEEIRTDKYLICNPFWLEDGFYTQIIYDSKYKELKEKSIKYSKNGFEVNHIRNLLRFKNPIWQFQNKSRFYIMAVALPELSNYNGDKLAQMKDIGIYVKN